MSQATYRGIKYDTERNFIKEQAHGKTSLTYRGIKYDSTQRRVLEETK